MLTVGSRRAFLEQAVGCSVTAAGLALGTPSRARGKTAPEPVPEASDHTLTTISGSARERGRGYGRAFVGPIRAFLRREILQPFAKNPPTRDELLRYADRCAGEIRRFSPVIHEELEGMAEGTGLRLEEIVLITLHEELYHRGTLPPVQHCTAIAAGPPDTRDGNTYVGQNWDWMKRLYGASRMLLWKRTEGPSVLAYAYPGLWIAAGLNASGIALCWTSTALDIGGPHVGIPTYVLIAQMLYQSTLEAAVEEARRAKQAGWFTFVLADGNGALANVEGSPDALVVESGRGHLVRVYYGTRQMTHTPKGKPIPQHPQCRRMCALVEGAKGRLDRVTLQGFFGDHASTICKHLTPTRGGGTLDSILFNATAREVTISRGPGCSGRWQRFGFAEATAR